MIRATAPSPSRVWEPVKTLALYTTVYPGVEGFLCAWHDSVVRQTDRDFQLWIGLDMLTSRTVEEIIGPHLKANWVTVPSGSTPAQIRQAAWSRLADTCDGVVLVDSDDLLQPSRVASARAALQTCDLAGCALRLIDHQGRDLGLTLGLPPHAGPGDVLPRNNVFGLSNTAFRTAALRQCLPIPAEARLVDWFIVTRAWLRGARLAFDDVPRMDYRQHPANMARVRAPFSQEQIVSDTAQVRRHFQLQLAEPLEHCLPDRITMLKQVSADIDEFHARIVLHSERLAAYAGALNALAPAPLWWSCVAHPALNALWRAKMN